MTRPLNHSPHYLARKRYMQESQGCLHRPVMDDKSQAEAVIGALKKKDYPDWFPELAFDPTIEIYWPRRDCGAGCYSNNAEVCNRIYRAGGTYGNPMDMGRECSCDCH